MYETPSWRFEPGPYSSHPTSTYTCEVTIAPKVCGDELQNS